MSEPVRLSKLMSERGLCSRREADSYIEKGLVFVDGKRVSELGTKVDPDCAIRLDAVADARQADRVTILLHKPVGYVSGQPEPGYQPAVTLIRPETLWQDGRAGRAFHPTHLKGLAPAGRLDIDSQGLLVLTQDGHVSEGSAAAGLKFLITECKFASAVIQQQRAVLIRITDESVCVPVAINVSNDDRGAIPLAKILPAIHKGKRR